MAAQSSILAWRIPLTKEVGCSPWSGKESHAQTQPPEVNWHVQSHGWQMPELSSDPKLWVLLFFFFFPVLCGSCFCASQREMALGASLGRSHTQRASRLCSHSRGSWIPALSLAYYQCFLLSAHFLCLDTPLF